MLLDQFRIVGRLGAGGYGATYLAEQRQMQGSTKAVVKFIRADLPASHREHLRRRFLREAACSLLRFSRARWFRTRCAFWSRQETPSNFEKSCDRVRRREVRVHRELGGLLRQRAAARRSAPQNS
jgi:hypothetical protein